MQGQLNDITEQECFIAKEKLPKPDDLDIQIVTPPPKTPATTITIPDSDTEGLEDKSTPGPSRIQSDKSSDNSPSNEETASSSSDPFIKPVNLPPCSPLNRHNTSSLPSHFLTPALPPRVNSTDPPRIGISVHAWAASSPPSSPLKPKTPAKSKDNNGADVEQPSIKVSIQFNLLTY